MKGKIGLEEHFAIQETLSDSAGFVPKTYWQELSSRLLDIHEKRLRLMDEHGMEMMILSLNAPAVQAIPDVKRANEIARRANDFLAEQVARRADRFQGFAALPMQDPDMASRELERCVKDFGFKGALVNGFSQIGDPNSAVYYDLPQYWSFWGVVEALDVPFYLHPRNPLPKDAAIYEGHRWLMGPAWAFGQETAVHALQADGLRPVRQASEAPDRAGSHGRGLPFSIWRVDYHNAWVNFGQAYPAKKKIGEYFSQNFHITTSGNFRTQSLVDAMLEIGSDRILFSTDWPFENIDHAADWFDAASISEADRIKIGRTNAIKLFKLGLGE